MNFIYSTNPYDLNALSDSNLPMPKMQKETMSKKLCWYIYKVYVRSCGTEIKVFLCRSVSRQKFMVV